MKELRTTLTGLAACENPECIRNVPARVGGLCQQCQEDSFRRVNRPKERPQQNPLEAIAARIDTA